MVNSYSDDSFCETLSLPSQFLALSAHGPECHIGGGGGGGGLDGGSRIRYSILNVVLIRDSISEMSP